MRVNGSYRALLNKSNNGFTPYMRLTMYPHNLIAAAMGRLKAFEDE